MSNTQRRGHRHALAKKSTLSLRISELHVVLYGVPLHGSVSVASPRCLKTNGSFKVASSRSAILDARCIDVADRLNLSVGANNLFDAYPERNGIINSDGSGAYGNFAPFGFSGGFYYGRLSWRL